MTSAADRVIDILIALAEAGEGLPLADLSRSTGLAKPTAHRLLADLARRGFVRAVDDDGTYALTLELAVLAHRQLAATGLLDLFRPELDRLADLSGELVRLGWRDGDRIVFIAEAQGAAPGLRYDANLGRPARLHATAAGKCFLAWLPPEEAARVVAAQGLLGASTLGPKAIRTSDALATDLARTRRRGFATAVDEGEVGAAAVAAPVIIDGAPPIYVASLAVIGPSVRLSRQRLTELAPEVVAAAGRIAARAALAPFCQRRGGDPRRIAEQTED